MRTSSLQGTFITSFNGQNLQSLMKKALPSLEINSTIDFNQWFLGGESSFGGDFLYFWGTPEALFPSFKEGYRQDLIKEDLLKKEVFHLLQKLKSEKEKYAKLFFVSWTVPYHQRGSLFHGSLKGGTLRSLNLLNQWTMDFFEKEDWGSIIDSERWFLKHGEKSFSAPLHYMAKIPFAPTIFKEASEDLSQRIVTLQGKKKKALVLDLDHTLWGGVVGDEGWEKLQIGGHSPQGEAYQDVQKILKEWKEKGILLALSSKNEEEKALEVFRKHPEMVLKEDDISAHRINWKDKAENIYDLVKELNIGLDSIVFLDDQAFERERVKEAFPQVYVPDLPKDPMLRPDFLRKLRCFDSVERSWEDQKRTHMLLEEKERQELKESFPSPEEWLKSLNIEVQIEAFSEKNQARILQLLNKTNQMNLRTRRLTQGEFKKWIEEENHQLWSFRVQDRLGDMGICGVVSIEKKEARRAFVSDFFLSCRAMGRKVETLMLSFLQKELQPQDIDEITLPFEESAKNKPMKDFLLTSGLARPSENLFLLTVNPKREFPKELTWTLPLFDKESSS